MATFKAVKNKKQFVSGLKDAVDYVSQEYKTTWANRQLLSGWNCVARSALPEMQATKELFHKTDGRQFYQFVQSFSPAENVTPEEVHAIGLELARELFPNFEVLVATHVDRDHLHSHLIVNSVSCVDGKKLHQNAADLQRQREISDRICMAHGLAVLKPAKKYGRGKSVSFGEYRSAAKGESWKFRLMNAIDLCMRRAKTKKGFIREMERLGYRVRWEENRKHITYTTPEGKKCRDVRLHDDKYLKEVMEYEFRIRNEILHRGTEETEYAAGVGDSRARFDAGELGRAAGYAGCAGLADADDNRVNAGAAGNSGTNYNDGGWDLGRGESTSEIGGTGWEAERAEAFAGAAGKYVRTAAPDAVDSGSGIGDAVDATVRLGRSLEMIGSGAPAKNTAAPPRHGDKKLRAREKEKKIALGHKADDHEDEQNYQQKM